MPRRFFRDRLYGMLPQGFQDIDTQSFQETLTVTVNTGGTTALVDGVPVITGGSTTVSTNVPMPLQVAFSPHAGVTLNFLHKSGHTVGDTWTLYISSNVSSNPVFAEYLSEGTASDALWGVATSVSAPLTIQVAIESNAHLKGYTDILAYGLDTIWDPIDNIQNLSLFKDEWFVGAWCEVMGFPELPSLLIKADLLALVPWLLRMYKLKGLMEPVHLIVRKIFDYEVSVVTIVPFDAMTGKLEILVSFDTSDLGTERISYLSRKLESMIYIINRFVPPYCYPLAVVAFSPFRDTYSKAIDDSRLGFGALWRETLPVPAEESVLMQVVHYERTDLRAFDIITEQTNWDEIGGVDPLMPLEVTLEQYVNGVLTFTY